MTDYSKKIQELEDQIKKQQKELDLLKELNQYSTELSFGGCPVDIEINPPSNNISNWNDDCNWKKTVKISCNGETGDFQFVYNLLNIYRSKFGSVTFDAAPVIGCLKGTIGELMAIEEVVTEIMKPIINKYDKREFRKVLKSSYGRVRKF